ncbi:response regulator transcription factor [Acidocella aromatica]|uniref:Two-component system KDP operon response regulator KdpE n=1 Tax=Acidocella aromatica TaxID=1303579 RepID=A0A840V782_9PROT|nr:response regulator transcription factor [Acidocella aromatica]MBB5371838.1 two-component system KDP operon response regulator KdpE [Acidocella aromatica]
MSIVSGRILVVDDEPQIHRFLTPALTAAGFEPLRAERGDAALRMVAANTPDLVLLDLGLPDMDGQDVLRRLRAFSAVPVIILSARDREAEKIAALDAGADDYVEKPFGLGELLARIRTALRHKGQQEPAGPELALDGLVITQQGAALNGEKLVLTKREHALLLLLARNHGRVLTHRQILTAIWGPAHAEDLAYLRVYIGQLRKKLGPDFSAKLKTEPGVGYRLEE